MNVIIPLCGKGMRFKKNGYNLPKPLIKIFDKEMIFYVLDNIKIEIIDQIFIIYRNDLDYNNFSEIVKNRYPNINLIKVTHDTCGAAETINIGINEIKKSNSNYLKKCLLLDCDTFYTENIIEIFKNQNNNAVSYTLNTEIKPIYSYICLDDNLTITQIIEKNKISHNACTGIYYFKDINELCNYSKKVIENNIKCEGEAYTSCIISEMIKDNHIFKGIELNNKNVFNLGTPEQIKNYIDQTYAFLFDLDGTLVITDEIYFNVWKIILKHYNIEITNDFFCKYIRGNNDTTVIKMLMPNIEININEISDQKDKLFIENIDKIFLVPDVFNFLKHIKMMGHKICIVTNCNRQVAEKIVTKCNFNYFIDFIITNNECSKPKPYPDPYIAALTKYNINSNRSFIFEDSKTGLLSGKSTNPKCLIGIETNYTSGELLNSGANITISNYNKLSIDDLVNYNDFTINKLKKNIINSLPHLQISDVIIGSDKLKGGYISDVLVVTLLLDNNTSKECVIKFENKNDTNLSLMAKKLYLYDREYYFYENLSKYVNINIPYFYGLIKDENFNNIGILMDNLIKKEYVLNIDLSNFDINLSLKIIESCAIFHSKFWNKQLNSSFPQLKKHNDQIFVSNMTEFIKEKWIIFKEKWKIILNSKQLKMAEKIMKNF